MTARTDYPHLAWQAANHERTELGRQSGNALDEIDRLRGIVAESGDDK